MPLFLARRLVYRLNAVRDLRADDIFAVRGFVAILAVVVPAVVVPPPGPAQRGVLAALLALLLRAVVLFGFTDNEVFELLEGEEVQDAQVRAGQ